MNAVLAEPIPGYREAFEAARPSFGTAEAARAAAFERFAELGFPASRDEAWKYTNLRRLAARRFPARSPESTAVVARRCAGSVPGRDRRWPPACRAWHAGVATRWPHVAHARGRSPRRRAARRAAARARGRRHGALCRAECGPVPGRPGDRRRAGDEPRADRDRRRRPTGSEAGMSHPRVLIRAARGSTARIVLRHVGDRRRRTIRQCRRGRRGRCRRRAAPLSAAVAGRSQLPHRADRSHGRATRHVRPARRPARRRPRPPRPECPPRRARGGGGTHGPVPRRWRAAPRHAPARRSPRSRHAQPAGLPRHCRRARSRRLQRQGHRAPGRAEVAGAADQPQPVAYAGRRNRHEARARDLRGRRPVQPRRDDGPARPRAPCSTCARAA